MTPEKTRGLYANRKLSEVYPDLEKLGVEHFSSAQQDSTTVARTMGCIRRLIDVPRQAKVAIVGCGPNPHLVKALLAEDLEASGVEPVAEWVNEARNTLGSNDRIKLGEAEALPYDDGSQHVVILESVLDHVDSPERALAEAYRVLRPGGVLFIETTNKYRFSPVGRNGEYQVRFFNWLPRLVQESYVHQHLHFDPTLANYTSRPAVHWFSYSGLCRLGRSAGFYRFYSKLDLLDPEDPVVRGSWLRRLVYERARCSPWLRSLVLIQYGNSIFMAKRP